MIHYHGTPITPRRTLQRLAGRNFCISAANPGDITECHRIGQSCMLDNGAWTFFNGGNHHADWDGYWARYYDWCEEWLDYPTTWAVIPDVINGTVEDNDRHLVKWFQRRLPKGAPVWHMHEPIERLKRLAHGYDRVCIGSSAAYFEVGSDIWHQRMTEAMNAVCGSGPVPVWLHMLRGMSLSGDIYPFASVDSTDIARNHWRNHNNVVEMADRWDGIQCPARWTIHDQMTLEVVNEL